MRRLLDLLYSIVLWRTAVARMIPLDSQEPTQINPLISHEDIDHTETHPFPSPPGTRWPLPGIRQRKYSEVTFIGAHNSPALRTEENGWILSGNQYYNLTTQLNAGIRLIQAQGHLDPAGSSQIRLCHFNCALMDGGSLNEYLLIAKTFLAANPGEVLTFLFVNVGVPLNLWTKAYQDTEFDTVSFVRPPSHRFGRLPLNEWPTIEEMSSHGKQAVTFLSEGADESETPWILPEFDYMFETDYNNESPSDFSCAVDRPFWPYPVIPNRLSLVNHFLYASLFGFHYPNASYANHTNGAGFRTGELGEHAARCRIYYERRPNFLLVDFFSEGDVWAVEHGMNAY